MEDEGTVSRQTYGSIWRAGSSRVEYCWAGGWNCVKNRGINSEVLRKNGFRSVCNPVGDIEGCASSIKIPVIKDK